MGNARFICPECKQPVKINGHKLQRGRVCYFAHFKDSDDCPYKTGTNRTKEEIERLKYSLVQESERHKRLKAVIASALEGEKVNQWESEKLNARNASIAKFHILNGGVQIYTQNIMAVNMCLSYNFLRHLLV